MSLDVRKLGFHYNHTPVLRQIGFSVQAGEILMILGPNGVGKTTLLKCLNRIHSPQTGQILVNGRDISTMGTTETARHIAYVAQNNPGTRMTVFDAVLMGRTPHIRIKAGPKDLEKTHAVMERLNIAHMGVKYLDCLSGGELQKVAIARALVQETGLLLLDEPTASLDLKNQTEILGLIRHIARDHGMAVVMTMHDLNAALRYGDRYLCLKEGRVAGTGPMAEISPDLVARVYGLDVEIIRHRGCPMVVPVAA
ncbi:MAG: ABC transporter ATP-binding protein [Desulfobacter sp.]|nr:MAG: ABC transporter ATP-binding protein [Desulfobacter sp.]